MTLVTRLLLGWTALSVVASPLVGLLFHRQQLDTVPAPVVGR